MYVWRYGEQALIRTFRNVAAERTSGHGLADFRQQCHITGEGSMGRRVVWDRPEGNLSTRVGVYYRKSWTVSTNWTIGFCAGPI
jgi:hypothetical protein